MKSGRGKPCAASGRCLPGTACCSIRWCNGQRMSEARKRSIAVVTTSRADYSHLYWPLHDLAAHPGVDLKLIVVGAHLSPEFGMTVREIEKDGFAIAGRVECLLSSDSDVGMAKTI